MGLGIVLFLVEHLITNSQAALFVGEDGAGFIRMVNFLHSLPYLQVLEVGLIGVPILYHGIWGIRVAIKGRFNGGLSDGTRPKMRYGRNYAYTWQRLTSWILLIGIILHVLNMRFIHYPIEAKDKQKTYFLTRVSMDRGLYTVCDRLQVKIFDSEAITSEKNSLAAMSGKMPLVDQKLKESQRDPKNGAGYDSETASIYNTIQRFNEKQAWVSALEKRELKSNQVIVAADNFGTATLLNVRDAFKNPVKACLYSIFVLAAVFHAFNGLWTFLISWGAILRIRSQRAVVNICISLMVIFAFLGLAAIWGSYWINLRN